VTYKITMYLILEKPGQLGPVNVLDISAVATGDDETGNEPASVGDRRNEESEIKRRIYKCKQQ
jgi:hypothetical protein